MSEEHDLYFSFFIDIPKRKDYNAFGDYWLDDYHMKVSYDVKTDTLSVVLRENIPVAESDEDKPGVILDYDSQGNLVSLEILDASKRVTEARKIEYQMTV